jgi:hypothetical protein
VRLLLLLILTAPLGVACRNDAEEAPSELVGVIVEVQSEPDGGIESFTLESDGDSRAIYIAPDVDYGFDLQHLHEHRTTGEPVRCVLEEREGRLYALEIVDAPAAT